MAANTAATVVNDPGLSNRGNVMPARMPEIQTKAVANKGLRRAYLRKLNQQNYVAAASTALIVTLSLFWLIFRLGGKEAFTVYSDAMYGITAWIGSFWVGRTLYQAYFGPVRLEPRHRLAWFFIGMGLFANGIAGFYYTYLEYRGHINPVPSLADVGFTAFYALTFLGLLCMPTEQKAARVHVHIALDAFITMLCILGISWFFVIGPIFKQLHNIPQLLVSVSYPFWDVLLILAILLLIGRRVEPVLRPSLLLCGVGILAQICGDTGYAIQIPAGTYYTGTFYIDPFWFIGALLIGLSVPYQYATIVRKVFDEQVDTPQTSKNREHSDPVSSVKPQRRLMLLQSLLIYIPLVVLLTITLCSELVHEDDRSSLLVILTAIVGLLVTIRYLLATQENAALLHERERRQEEAEQLRQLTAKLTEILELNSLLEHIVKLAVSELNFDAAILILIEEYDAPFEPQSNLLLRAASSTTGETLLWRFRGSQLPGCSSFFGQETEILWSAYTQELPGEMQLWLQEQHISATLFVPLVYQGRTLGSLGFSSRTHKQFGECIRHRARTFAEQAATALKHARLYEAACEHELFSQALANVATRLNNFVTGAGEIHELICTEGANALQADYALLYTIDRHGQLVPIAAYAGDQETPCRPSDWPYIRQYDFEVQSLTALQPTLVTFDQLTTSGALPVISAKLPTLRDGSSQTISISTGPLSAYSTVAGLRERHTSSLRGALMRRYVHTAILAPLIARGDPVALLILARTRPPGTHKKRAFTPMDLGQAQDFSEQAAIAFTNAHLYQQLRTAHQRLQELDQLKDQFMVTASHELRTPLTAVQGYLELLAEYDKVLPPQQREEFLQKARRGCDELVLLLSNVMDASRLEVEAGIRPAAFEKVSVQEAIQHVVELLEPQVVQEQRELRFQIPAHLYVRADPARLRQVLLNISTNALKYSPPGTPIIFSARTTPDQMGSAIISITDRGKGIKLKDQAILFQRFVRLESDLNSTVRGSGLGLYISRRLIEAMEGKIWVESKGSPGTGSTFHILLPLA